MLLSVSQLPFALPSPFQCRRRESRGGQGRAHKREVGWFFLNGGVLLCVGGHFQQGWVLAADTHVAETAGGDTAREQRGAARATQSHTAHATRAGASTTVWPRPLPMPS